MFVIIAAALAAAATPGSAPAATPQPTPTTAVTGAPERRYCTQTYTTGSRLPRVECHTRADWLKQGFDPLAPDE